jgi:hypothetical protein
VQRRDEIVVLFTRLVIEKYFALQRILDGLSREAAFGRSRGGCFQRVVGRPRVAVGVDGDLLQQILGSFHMQILQAAFQEGHDLRDGQQAQRVDFRSRKQGGDYLEGRILRGGTD